MFGVARLSERLPNNPEVVPNSFRKVTCLRQGNPEMEGHELLFCRFSDLSFVRIVLWISVSLFSIVFLGLTQENGINDSFRAGSNPQFWLWFVNTELNILSTLCWANYKAARLLLNLRRVCNKKNSVMSNTGKKSKWNLSVFITNLSTEKSVEVNGETHVGKLMLDLVEGLGKCLNVITARLWFNTTVFSTGVVLMSSFKTKLILLVRVRQNMFSLDVLYFYVEMFQVFARVMYWNLKASEHPPSAGWGLCNRFVWSNYGFLGTRNAFILYFALHINK